MKHESTDLRVRRTLKCIREAFFSLILEKPYSQISITELTTKADINRKTFYLHYSSLDDLVHEIEIETASNLLAYLEKDAKDLNVAGCFSNFYRYMNNAPAVLKKLLCDDSYLFFYNDVTDLVLKSSFFQHFYDRTAHPDLVRAYCIGITSIYRTWYSDGQKLPIDDLVSYSSQLLVHGYDSVVVNPD